MKNRTFTPFVGFGDIKFGAKRSDIIALLNADYQTIRHSPEDKRFYDFYDDLGFKVEYFEDDTVIGIETFNFMNFPCIFIEKNLIPMTFAELERFFKKIAPDTEPYDIGFSVPSLGFAVCYTDFQAFPDEPTQSFCMVRKDYLTLPL